MSIFQTLKYMLSALWSFLFKKQKVVIEEIPSGKTIDIGGGGEGIIAQIGAERVTAVDKLESEIKSAQAKAPTATWQVADARNLPFENESFDNATIFFSLMYMKQLVKEEVISEVYRVLPPCGEFWIWDANIQKEGIFVIMMKIKLPNGKIVRTGYGTKDCIQSPESISEILQKTGFQIKETITNKLWFLIKAKKAT
ncbi:MAG: class I SAM-dependent methyltransferase [Asgard group archaeon]|nr:class I SAM-dependent methyltransferase [Asgard group archaeon]